MPPVIEIYTDPGKDGFWGNITSSIDWCEENYVVSYYIAEFCKLFNFYKINYYHFLKKFYKKSVFSSLLLFSFRFLSIQLERLWVYLDEFSKRNK